MKTRAAQRWLPFLLYLLAIATLFGSIAGFGWIRTWSAIFVPTMSLPFADMRVIAGAVTSADEGLNPLISNPNDPWRRPLNYPPIWVKIGQAANLPDESRFIQVCSLMIFSFVAICAYLLYRFPSYLLLACALSTATLFAIERGNIDLIIYALVFGFAFVFPRKLSPIPILIATVLKLYPVFLLGVLLIKRQFILFFTALIFVLAIFGYMWGQLPFIGRSAGPATVSAWTYDRVASYGFPIIALHLSEYKLPSWMMGGVIIVISLMIFVVALYFRKINSYLMQTDRLDFSLFLAGSSIYLGTFIFSPNWDYRLIFLIFCVPFLETKRFPLGSFLVILIIVAMNDRILTPWLGEPGLAIVWFAKILVFAVLCGYLAAFVPTIFNFRRSASEAITRSEQVSIDLNEGYFSSTR